MKIRLSLKLITFRFEPKVGTLVCVHYNDIFVRAVVLKTEYCMVESKSIFVRFVDYGDKLWIKLKAVSIHFVVSVQNVKVIPHTSR